MAAGLGGSEGADDLATGAFFAAVSTTGAAGAAFACSAATFLRASEMVASSDFALPIWPRGG